MSSDGPQLIKESLSFGQFVGRYTSLTRKGSRLMACCPIHKEKTPSFYLDESKGFFHCFGCGKGGDLIKFCMEMEGLEFLDALEFLAEIAGIDLPKRGHSGPGREMVESIREVNAAAVSFYQAQLGKTPEAQAYLKERGITAATANLFRLGYAPAQWDALYLHLSGKFDEALLQASGLFKEGRTGKPYDIFRSRIIFPIRDVYGHTIAFGGRIFGDEEGPKYINSPETPLYTKGKHVYNMDFAKVFLKKKPENGVVVVEGYLDVIQLYQAGVTHVIAGLGTAFTQEQGKLLKRFIKKVVLNYDGDAAGFKAARAAIEIFLPLDLELNVVTLPQGMDPDDYIRKYGATSYQSELAKAEDFLNYLFRFLVEGQDTGTDPHLRSRVARELMGILDKIEDPIVREHYIQQVAVKLVLSRDVLDQVRPQKAGKTPAAGPRRDVAKAPPADGPRGNQARPQTRPAPSGATPSRDLKSQKGQKGPKPAAMPRVETPPSISYGPEQHLEPVISYGPEPGFDPEDVISYGPEPVLDHDEVVSYGPEPELDEDDVISYSPGPIANEGIIDCGPEPTRYGPSSEPPSYHEAPEPEYYEPIHDFEPENTYAPSTDYGYRKDPSNRKPWQPWRKPVPVPLKVPAKNLFNKMEEEFLFHVMHVPDFTQAVAEQHREILPKILANIFADRAWVLSFVYNREAETFDMRMEAVPEEYRDHLARINFLEEFDEEDSQRLEQLCPDLLCAMLHKLAEINHQRLRSLPPSEIDRRNALVRQNLELRRQANKLRS